MSHSNQDDKTSFSLLERVKTDDELAWQQLVHVYGPLVVRWCKQSGLNEADAADVYQETFQSVANGFANFQPRRSVGSFRSWLRTITRTKIVDFCRRLNKHPAGRGGSTAQVQFANLADPHEDADDDESGEDENAIIVRRAMELVQPEFNKQNWAAFQQVAIEGRSATDVSQELGINAQTVRQANYRIRRRLRVLLAGLLEL